MHAWETSAKLSRDSRRFIGFVCFSGLCLFAIEFGEIATCFISFWSCCLSHLNYLTFSLSFSRSPSSFSPFRVPFFFSPQPSCLLKRLWVTNTERYRWWWDGVCVCVCVWEGVLPRLLQASCHMPWLLMTHKAPSGSAEEEIRNQRTSNISECHQH